MPVGCILAYKKIGIASLIVEIICKLCQVLQFQMYWLPGRNLYGEISGVISVHMKRFLPQVVVWVYQKKSADWIKSLRLLWNRGSLLTRAISIIRMSWCAVIYNYIEACLFDVRNIDLPRKVKFRERYKKPEFKVDKGCRIDHNYKNFCEFLEKNPDINIVHMDSVIGENGEKGGKYLLTIRVCEEKSVNTIFYDITGESMRKFL